MCGPCDASPSDARHRHLHAAAWPGAPSHQAFRLRRSPRAGRPFEGQGHGKDWPAWSGWLRPISMICAPPGFSVTGRSAGHRAASSGRIFMTPLRSSSVCNPACLPPRRCGDETAAPATRSSDRRAVFRLAGVRGPRRPSARPAGLRQWAAPGDQQHAAKASDFIACQWPLGAILPLCHARGGRFYVGRPLPRYAKQRLDLADQMRRWNGLARIRGLFGLNLRPAGPRGETVMT